MIMMIIGYLWQTDIIIIIVTNMFENEMENMFETIFVKLIVEISA